MYPTEPYKIGNSITFIKNFRNEKLSIDEYIHCIILEYLKVDREGRPEKIKVLQIHNLEDFDKTGNRNNTSEREFYIRDISHFINYKTV